MAVRVSVVLLQGRASPMSHHSPVHLMSGNSPHSGAFAHASAVGAGAPRAHGVAHHPHAHLHAAAVAARGGPSSPLSVPPQARKVRVVALLLRAATIAQPHTFSCAFRAARTVLAAAAATAASVTDAQARAHEQRGRGRRHPDGLRRRPRQKGRQPEMKPREAATGGRGGALGSAGAGI